MDPGLYQIALHTHAPTYVCLEASNPGEEKDLPAISTAAAAAEMFFTRLLAGGHGPVTWVWQIKPTDKASAMASWQ